MLVCLRVLMTKLLDIRKDSVFKSISSKTSKDVNNIQDSNGEVQKSAGSTVHKEKRQLNYEIVQFGSVYLDKRSFISFDHSDFFISTKSLDAIRETSRNKANFSSISSQKHLPLL